MAFQRTLQSLALIWLFSADDVSAQEKSIELKVPADVDYSTATIINEGTRMSGRHPRVYS